MSRISVLLVDDHPVVLQGVSALLRAHSEIEVIGEAADGPQAVAFAQQLRPNVVVIDLAMPLMNGVEATRRILESVPQTRVLVLTSYGQEKYIREAMKAGAKGYVLKQTAGEELAQAVQTVFMDQFFFSPRVAAILSPTMKSESDPNSTLTLREGQVLQLFAEGYTEAQIAEELGISRRVVRQARSKVMRKLQITGEQELKNAGLRLETL